MLAQRGGTPPLTTPPPSGTVDLEETYEIDQNLLRLGSTSLVTKCHHRVNRKTFAVKVR